MRTLYALGCVLPVIALFHLSAAYSTQEPPLGTKGYARYSVRDTDLGNKPLKPGTQLLNLRPGLMELLVPIDDLHELDDLGGLSHEATGFCGSIDFFPLHYELTATVSHKPPYFAASAHFADLTAILDEVQLPRLDATIDTLAAMPSRFHRHSTGQNTSQTVTQIFQAQLPTPSDWTIKEFLHTNTPQRSVIARLEGSTTDTIVLGAHLDSIQGASRSNFESPTPGADDDASGIAILTEILRIIEAKHLRFHKSIELQGYAAEEVGLVGSREIAANYRASNKVVDAMLQFDMAYYSRVPADGGMLFFLEDFTSLDLTRSGIAWVKDYLGEVYRRGAMPIGAASDHKSWFEQGYPTLFPFENALADNPFIHTINDVRDKFDDGTRMQLMVKFGLIFLAYHAGLESLDAPYLAEQDRLSKTPVSADLFLAITGSAGQYSFTVSAPETTSFLEFCQTESASDYRCSQGRLRLTASETVSGRKLFHSDGKIAFNADEKWRVEAYDSADVLLSRRQILWAAP